MEALICILAAVSMGIATTYFTLKSILAVSYRRQLFDLPGERRVHKTPTSRLGGFAFAPLIICITILAASLYNLISPTEIVVTRYLVLICPLIFLHLMGLIDDLMGVRYRVKFLVQVIAGLAVIYSGLWIDNLHGLFGIYALPEWVGMPLTLLFIVFMINAFNLIDGIDGLAAGLCIIALVIYGTSFAVSGEYLFAFVAFASLGVLLPFFYTNVWGLGKRKRKLFMGDVGSLSIGMVVTILSVASMMDTVGVVHTDANFILAVSPLLVPVFDVLHVVLARLKNGRNPFRADKTHIHHRLLQKGFGQDWTVVLILGLAASYTLVNVLLAPYLNVTVILLLDAAVWFIFNSRLLQPYKRHEKKGLRKGGFGKGGFGNGNLQKNSSENATHF